MNTAGDIFTINPDGADETNITNSSSWENAPTWSPNGKRIAFEGDGAAAIMNADGGGPVTRLSAPIFSGPPAWAPDGHRLVVNLMFNCCTSRPPAFLAVFSDDAPGHYVAITPVDDDASGADPVWSPNGDKIAYFSNLDRSAENGSSIYVINTDGTGRVRLTDGPGFDEDPDWSPDGRKIVFSSRRDGRSVDIYTMNADGSDQRRLTNTSQGDLDPVWSPDGRKILFERTRDDNNGRSTSDIYEINADGMGETLLVPDAQYPDWQPIPGPQRSDFKNAAQFCKAERAFLGDAAFARKYSLKANPANAFGQCVRRNH